MSRSKRDAKKPLKASNGSMLKQVSVFTTEDQSTKVEPKPVKKQKQKRTLGKGKKQPKTDTPEVIEDDAVETHVNDNQPKVLSKKDLETILVDITTTKAGSQLFGYNKAKVNKLINEAKTQITNIYDTAIDLSNENEQIKAINANALSLGTTSSTISAADYNASEDAKKKQTETLMDENHSLAVSLADSNREKEQLQESIRKLNDEIKQLKDQSVSMPLVDNSNYVAENENLKQQLLKNQRELAAAKEEASHAKSMQLDRTKLEQIGKVLTDAKATAEHNLAVSKEQSQQIREDADTYYNARIEEANIHAAEILDETYGKVDDLFDKIKTARNTLDAAHKKLMNTARQNQQELINNLKAQGTILKEAVNTVTDDSYQQIFVNVPDELSKSNDMINNWQEKVKHELEQKKNDMLK